MAQPRKKSSDAQKDAVKDPKTPKLKKLPLDGKPGFH
jgi:hypothetical protein